MDFFRNRRNSVITIVVFGFIILTFIFWGFYHKEDFSQGRPISVNGEEISVQDFNRAFQNRMNQFSQFYGGKKMSGGMEELIRKQTAKALVMRLAMAQEADSLGLLVGDEDIKEEIKNYAAFKNPATGNFSPQHYKDALLNYGYTPARFEKEIRQDLMVDRLQNVLDNTLLISTAEVKETKRVQDFSFTLDSAVFTAANLAKAGKITLTDAELKTYFDKNTQEFMHPERRVLEIASLAKSALESKVTPSDADLKKYFSDKIQSSADPQWKQARAHAKHLLLSQKGDKGKSAILKLKNEIEALSKTIGIDAAFSKVAKEKSEDIGSAARNGDLGYFVAGTMDKAFADAVFNKKNPLMKVIGPVESQFGQHLILVLDRTGEENKFETRKKEIEALVRTDLVRENIRSLKERLNKELAGKNLDNPATLSELSATSSISRPITKSQNDAQVPFALAQRAFNASLLQWSEAEEFDDSIKITRVKQIIAPKPMTFDEAKALVREKIQNQRAEDVVKQIEVDLRAGKLEWRSLASYQATLKKEPQFKAFSSREVPGFSDIETVLKAATGLTAQNPISTPIFQEGQWILFKASDFKDPALMDEAALKETRQGLQFARKSDVFDQFVEDLIKKARIPKAQREAYDL